MALLLSVGFMLFNLFFHCLSKTDLTIGNNVSITVPCIYEASFQGRAFFMDAGDSIPNFKAGLSVEAIKGKSFCGLDVFLGDFRVWNSGRFWHFNPSGTCVLELLDSGVLQLSDSTGQIGWRTGTYGQGVKRLELQRTGNLILTDTDNNTKWQSFDFPADIMLWNQRLYPPAHLTAFAENSMTLYSFEIQQDKIAMHLYSNGHNYSYWEFKPSGNRNIAFVKLGSTGLKIFDRQYRKFAQFRSNGRQPIRFLALGSTGNMGFYHYSAHKGKFEASFQLINSTCDLPLPCGSYGICTSPNNCNCMQFSKGPKRIQSDCNEAFSNGFCGSGNNVKMVELPGVSSVLRGSPQKLNVSKEECLRACMKDCTCSAVLFTDKGIQQECFLYELVGGVKQFQGQFQSSYLVKALKEANRSMGSPFSIKKLLLILAGVVDGVAVILIFGGLIFYFVKRKRRKDITGANA